MELTNKNDLKSLLGKYNIRLTKKLGQHFLIDHRVLEKIIAIADLKQEDTILEVGPGIGTLTYELAKKVKKVIAIEKDKNLVKPLRIVLKNFTNVEIVNQDFLTYPSAGEAGKLPATTYKVVADIPYYITGKILRRLFSASLRPSAIILLVQREVAERITAAPGKMSLMSVAAQLYSNPEIIDLVSENSFYPPPKVESAIVRLKVLKDPRIPVEEVKFFRLARIGFAARRKTLLNNLSAGLKIQKKEIVKFLKQAGIAENVRAQELSMEEWGELYRAVQIPNF